VRAVCEEHSTVYRLEFTEYPEATDIPLVVADLIYNVRSGLDHLMSALVHPSKRRSVYFPIFFHGVWEGPVPGDGEHRLRQRERWRSETATVSPAALGVLKALQPRGDAGDEDPMINVLSALNPLAVKDRHVKLPFTAPSLRDDRLVCKRADGARAIGLAESAPHTSLEDGAKLNGVPHEAVHVKIEGTPTITIKIGGPNSHLRVPDAFSETISMVETMLAALSPHVYRGS
jgi:hypothetical protein